MGRGQKNCFEVRPHFAVELHIADLLSITLILCLPDNFAYFLSSADFFRNQLFRKKFSGIPSECQTVSIQIRPNILWGLI